MNDAHPVSYIATCLYGLESLLAGEVTERLGAPTERHWCEVVFPWPGATERLLDLRLAGNLFIQFDEFSIGHTVSDLNALAERVRRLPFGEWEERWRDLQELPDEVLSVSVNRRGEHNYSYKQVEECVIAAVEEGGMRRAILDPRPLELRVTVDGSRCRLAGRLTPRSLADRTYLRYRAPSETDPTLAAAMVRLGRPASGDAFLDPFCGVGVIPIERALTGPAGRIAAGDVKGKFVDWARANAEQAGASVEFGVWDAFELSFGDASFDRIVTSPPQSDPATGRPWNVERFARLMDECLRVLTFNGVSIWLMQHGSLFGGALKLLQFGRRADALACNWKGRRWTVYTLTKAL